MVKKYTRKHSKLVKKKRKWFKVVASKEHFNSAELGEVLAVEGNKLIGRIITTSISNVSSIRNPNISIKFKINDVKEDKAFTEVVGYEMSQAFVKRATRKNKSKIDYSLKLKTKDNLDVDCKVLLVTRNIVSARRLTDIRSRVKEFLVNYFNKHNFNDIFSKVLSRDLQNEVKGNVKNVYPLNVAEIRFLKKK